MSFTTPLRWISSSLSYGFRVYDCNSPNETYNDMVNYVIPEGYTILKTEESSSGNKRKRVRGVGPFLGPFGPAKCWLNAQGDRVFLLGEHKSPKSALIR